MKLMQIWQKISLRANHPNKISINDGNEVELLNISNDEDNDFKLKRKS